MMVLVTLDNNELPTPAGMYKARWHEPVNHREKLMEKLHINRCMNVPWPWCNGTLSKHQNGCGWHHPPRFFEIYRSNYQTRVISRFLELVSSWVQVPQEQSSLPSEKIPHVLPCGQKKIDPLKKQLLPRDPDTQNMKNLSFFTDWN